MQHLWSPWRMEYINHPVNQRGCIFCLALQAQDGLDNLVVTRGQSSFVILNRYPYTTGHLMVVPFDHYPSIEALTPAARAELMELTSQALQVLRAEYQPQGFNIGINMGEIAGAGVADHVHIHVVPRWGGDTNFMSTVSQTRVIPEALSVTHERIWRSWHNPVR